MRSAGSRLMVLGNFIAKNCLNPDNNNMESIVGLQDHPHLLEHYNSINDGALKQRFMTQVQSIDFDKMKQLYENVYLHNKNKTLV